MRTLTIGSTVITDESPCYVVAEIGSNHQGDLQIAHQLIEAAAACGAHAVKFQKRANRSLYAPALFDAPYESEQSFGSTYGSHREALEFGAVEYRQLSAWAVQAGLTWFATAFDERSADLLVDVGAAAIKLPSGALTDLTLIRYVSSLGLPLILSTGGGDMTDIDRAVTAGQPGSLPFALLHCTASYPAAFDELNLRCIVTLRERYPDVMIGWSGHDSGIAMATAAVTLGARIIEKHFTLNRALRGTDHAFSLEPAGLRKLTRDLSRLHVAMGDGVKRYYASERRPIAKMRRRQTPDGWQITGERDV